MTDEYDRKLAADGIRAAIDVVNKAIIEASKVGVRIEDMREVDVTTFEDRCPAIIYDPIIMWKEVL